MNEKAWSDFEKTGSVMDYLNYRLSAPDAPVGAVRAEMPRAMGKRGRKPLFTAERLNDADKNKGNSPSGAGL